MFSSPPRGIRRQRRFRAFPLALVIFFAAVLAPVAEAAPRVQPWTPTGMDSLTAWALQARRMFRENTGDSLGGNNFLAYQKVGQIGQSLLGSLGRGNLSQAYAVEAVIDSLGLTCEVAADPLQPYFAMIFVRNPFRETADVVGYIYWYQLKNLRYQGVRFTSGRHVQMRVWRARYPDQPFSCGVLENSHYGSKPLEFTLLRMGETGLFWTSPQYFEHGIDLGGRGEGTFADLNNDGVPELVTWTRSDEDSLFEECRGCPGLLAERTWAEREEGFGLIESRLMPTAYANLVLFIRLLRAGNREAAARLLDDPSRITEAIANGWDRGSGRALWRVLNVEQDETWPRWMVMRFGRGEKQKDWVFHFVVRDGRWIIHDWQLEKPATPQVRTR